MTLAELMTCKSSMLFASCNKLSKLVWCTKTWKKLASYKSKSCLNSWRIPTKTFGISICRSWKKLLLEITTEQERSSFECMKRWKIDRRFAFYVKHRSSHTITSFFFRAKTAAQRDQLLMNFLFVNKSCSRSVRKVFVCWINFSIFNRLILKKTAWNLILNIFSRVINLWKMFDFFCFYILCPWLLCTLYIVLTMLFIK